MYIGCHLSASKGYKAMGKQAIELGANTFAFFTRNPRGGSAKEIVESDVEAFLALAGPVGWGVAGVTLLSSIVLFSMKKLKLNKHKKEEIEAVKKNTNSTRKVTAQIQVLLDEVVSLREALSLQYNECMPDFGKDFTSIPKDQQMRLGALVNNTKALAVSLSKSIQ